MGSQAYGVSSESSDIDIYGICIPPKEEVFPHLRGEIQGFGRQKQRFEQYQQHHIIDSEAGKEYDLTIYNITKYFSLAMDNNPNIVDSLFVPRNCVCFSTQIGELIRQNRTKFLHKGSFQKFLGYAYSQLHKIKNNKSAESSRKELIAKHGYDTKFAYHIYRLADEADQILSHGDIDLQRANEVMKAIRRGQWPLDKLLEWFDSKEKALTELYSTSKLQHSPNEDEIKGLLVQCLESHYGDLSDCIKLDLDKTKLIDEIQEKLDLLRKTL